MHSRQEVADKLRELADEFESLPARGLVNKETEPHSDFLIHKLVIDRRVKGETWKPVYCFEEEAATPDYVLRVGGSTGDPIYGSDHGSTCAR